MILNFSPWVACVVTFILGLTLGWVWREEHLRKKFPDLYCTMRRRALEEELAENTQASRPGNADYNLPG